MTERHDDQDAFDDELAAALRAEVPGPGAGYWDRIAAMLERAADERDGADPGYADPGYSSSADDDMDTAATVIRLTAMNENDTIETTPRTTGTTRAPESTTARRFGGTSLLARAAALMVLLGAIGTIAWIGANNGDGPGETVNSVAGPGTDESTGSEGDTDPPSDPASESDTTATPDPDLTAVDPAERPEWVGSLLPEQLIAADIEAIGCWFRVDQDVDSDVVFHGGFEGGYMMLQGELVELAPGLDATEIEWWTVSDYADQAAGEPRWAVSLTDVGEPVETTIESSDRAATLTVTAADGTTWSTPGVLSCGV